MLAYDFSHNGLYYDILSTEDRTCEVANYSSSPTSVVIPSTVIFNGTTYTVTSIGSLAFEYCSSLAVVEIPSSVTSIGDYAFSRCSSLAVVEIPSSVTSIGDYAFSRCSSLAVVEIPSSVTSIGSSAFAECSSLTAVEIGNSVTSIGESAFYGCSSLTSVEIPNSVTQIPSSVTSIGNSAFEDCIGLTAVEIPNSVTSIGNSAFYGCSKLHSVTIGTGVLSIDQYAFDRPEKVIWLCNTPPEGYTNAQGSVNYVANTSYGGLRNVKVYPYLSSLFEVGGIKYVPVSPSERTCEAIDCAYDTTSVVRIGRTVNYQGVEMTVEDIRPYTCYDNDHVKALHLDGYVGDLGDEAFYDCDSLAGVTILNTEGDLGRSCFQGCTALTQADINVNGDLGESCFQSCTDLTQAILGDSITEIGSSCFENCSSLVEITIPATVKSLGSSCFESCTALTQATIGTGVTKIPWSCFNGCASLAEITIPASVNSIGNNVFEGCTSLANVTIADRDSVLALGYNDSWDDEPMFADCPLNAVYIGGNISYSTDASDGYSPFSRNTSLETVTITDKETEISENEFYGCTNLKNVTLGDGIETIGSYAFSGCAALTDFTFGSSLDSIGEEAFSDCTAMTRLVSRTATPPRCGPQALDDINKWTCKLYVPDASIDAYQSADQWKEFFFITDIAHAVDDGDSAADRILSGRVQVFDLSGRQVKEARNASSIDDVLNGLPTGTYILRGSGAAMKVIHE